MFEHSVKVPRLYKTAAKIAQKVKEDGSSLKQLVYEKKHPNLKALYALVLNTLTNDDNLNTIIRHSQLLIKENRLDPWLARVLITELLWGKKKLPGESKPIKTIRSYQDEFLKENIVEKKPKSKNKKVNKPKYVRVNNLKISTEEMVHQFQDEGWSLVRCGNGIDYSAFLATSASLSEEQFMVDTMIKDVLIFPPGSQFYEHKFYKNGCFLLQDKSSCLAPYLLNPSVGATVLDMCAAPGMKCMQIAAMVEKTGKVYAVERDARRYETLKKLLDNADATNVTAINKDVLSLVDGDVPGVEYILVDPSCSGSGMLDRVDFEDESSHCNESRLQKLAGFQITILRHALNNFKSVKRIVYSTCSIYPQENEQVVQQAITTTPDFKLVPLNETLKDKWYNFGSENYNIGPRCLYAKPEIDKTNGFFIAVFERLHEGENNEFFVKRVQRTSECEHIEETTDLKLKKHKKKKRKTSETSNNENMTENNKTAKSKRTEDKEIYMEEVNTQNEEKMTKKKKRKNSETSQKENLTENNRKTKSIKTEVEIIYTEEVNNENNTKNEEKITKKKKRKNSETSPSEIMTENNEKTKSKQTEDEKINTEEPNNENNSENEEKMTKKKKKHKNKQVDEENIKYDQEIDENNAQEICIDISEHKKSNKKNKKIKNQDCFSDLISNEELNDKIAKNNQPEVKYVDEENSFTEDNVKKCKKRHKEKEKPVSEDGESKKHKKKKSKK